MTKTHEIIPITDGYVVVENAKIQTEDGWFVSFKLDSRTIVEGIHKFGEYASDNADRKIIASIGIKIKGVPLIEEVDEVEQLAKDWTKSRGYTNSSLDDKYLWSREQASFKAGYKANTKQYSEEDLRKAFKAGENRGSWNRHGYAKLPMDAEDYLKSLQKVPISIELEYENLGNKGAYYCSSMADWQLKVNPNNTITPKSISYG